jgi:hypothetical protein
VTVNCVAEEVPPPGAGVVTLTVAVPDEDSDRVGIIAVSCVDETKAVASACPLKLTTDTLVKPNPVTVMVVSAEPCGTEDGEMDVNWGNG